MPPARHRRSSPLLSEGAMGSKSRSKTASRCITEVETGTHVFEIVGYSLKRGIGIGNFVRSSPFAVGGHDWAIRFYPDGLTRGTRGFSAVSLELMAAAAAAAGGAKVRALYHLLLVNQATGLSEAVMCPAPAPTVFSPSNYFILRETKLENESSGYIVDDCLAIECRLTVIKESELLDTVGPGIQVPPSDLSEHLGRALLDGEGADVVFSVGGETFAVHRVVLASRSPVFRAELYGQMMEGKARRVTVEDMQPDVFRALLHFVYTDALPAFIGDDGLAAPGDHTEMVRHLLVAADRYAMDRLKLLCASVLAQDLDVDNVMTTLALASQHSCKSLKDVCIEFMAPSDKMDAVVRTQGYADIKRTCPSLIDDVEEKTRKYRKARAASFSSF